jgi:spore germination cell wall hydrolase CwlJ-like protein
LRRFVQPPFLRRVTITLLLCWFVPLLGTLGAGIFFAGVGYGPANHELARQAEAAEENPEGNEEKREENEGAASAVTQPDPAGNGTAPVGASRGEAGRSVPAAPAGRNQRVASGQSPGPLRSSAQNNRDYNENLALLARVIFAEARGESIEGQVAVGAVLLNRVKSPNFPNNLWSNIFRSGEFCTVRDGQIWLEPDAKAYRAAQLALDGWDPTYGALFFYNPARTTSRWIWSRPVTTRIGRHIFAR